MSPRTPPHGESVVELRALRPEDEGAFRVFAREYAADGDHRYTAGLDDFAAYTKRLERWTRREGLPPGKVPGKQEFLFSGRTPLGGSRLRLELNEALELFGGNIGYDIRPSERGRGFGTTILGLTLVLARSHDLGRVIVTCDPENHASRRVIEKNGGVEIERGVTESGRPALRFVIDLQTIVPVPRGPEPLEVRPAHDGDRTEVTALLDEKFGSTTIVSRGRAHDALALDGIVCLRAGRLLGVASRRRDGARAELVALAVAEPRRGIGRRLVAETAEAAHAEGARGLVLVTTDNHEVARAFYRSCGFRRIAIHEGAVDEARLRYPHIPTHDEHGRPLRDEIEYDLRL